MTAAPHLPKKATNEPKPYKWYIFRWAIAICVLAILTAVAVSLYMFNWLYPLTVTDSGSLFVVRNKSAQEVPTQDPSLTRQLRAQLITLYDAGKANKDLVYPKHAKLGTVVTLSSDGWAVMYHKGAFTVGTKALIGVDHQGIVHQVQKVVSDTKHDLVYIKFNDADFHSASFPHWDDVTKGDYVWSINGAWEYAQVAGFERTLVNTYKPWDDTISYIADRSLHGGSVVVDNSGQFVGFVISEEHTKILPAWYIEYHLPTMLEHGTLRSDKVGWSGYMVDGWVDQKTGVWRSDTAFYVTKPQTPKTKIGPLLGDLILRIHGKPIQEDTFTRMLYAAPEQFEIAVLRDGAEVQVMVDK